jgi:methylated-DNA-[protein]-cysteine S-methyltransferase
MDSRRSGTELVWLPVTSDLGEIALVASPEGLRGVVLPDPAAAGRSIAASVHRRYPEARRGTTPLVERFAAQLRIYLAGGGSGFDGSLDLGDATPFEAVVWETTRTIPYGETRTYGWVARAAGDPSAVRAVGQALGRNPLPIVVPCHRVLAADGSLGGFALGREMKRTLLALEGLAPHGRQTELPL